eukprot:7702418-Ditylum_brightwellii.AAC.1
MPQPPSAPLKVDINSKDGSTITVEISSPENNGGEELETYRIDYSMDEFQAEKQLLSLSCLPNPEIQKVTTSASDINEIQLLIIDSDYHGEGIISEIQQVKCDATGGTFALTLGGENAYINYDADETAVKASLESLTIINEVSIDFNGGTKTA